MPTYLVTAPDGRRIKLTGDGPPSDADIDSAFGEVDRVQAAAAGAVDRGALHRDTTLRVNAVLGGEAEGFDDLIPADSGEGRVKTAAKNLAAGAVGTAAAGLKGLAVLNADVAEMPSPYASLMRQAGAAGPPEGQRTYQAGQRLDRVVAEDIAPNPRYRNSFWASTLPQGLGSTVALLPTAIAGPAGIATSGALVSGGAAYDEAKAAGADDDAAHRVFWQNALAGTTEAIPLSRILDRINKSSGGTLSRAVRDMLSSGLEEGAQEAFQQTVGNLVARHAYDDERRLLEGVGQGGAAGFITGALFAGAGTGANRLLQRGQGQEANRGWTRMDADGGQTGTAAQGPSAQGAPPPGQTRTPPPGPTGEAVPPGTPGAGTGPTAVPPVPTSVDDVRRLVGEVTTPEALASLLQDAGVQQAVATASPVEQQTLTLAVQERALELEQGSQESEVGSQKSPSAGAFDDLVPRTAEEDFEASVDRTRINAGPVAPQEPSTEAAGDVPAAVETALPAGPDPVVTQDQVVAPTEMIPSGVVPIEDQATIRAELDAELGQEDDSAVTGGATITGSNEGQASEMPAELGATPAPTPAAQPSPAPVPPAAAPEVAKAEPERSSYWDEPDGRTVVQFTRADFGALAPAIQQLVRARFLWSPSRKAWISRARKDKFWLHHLVQGANLSPNPNPPKRAPKPEAPPAPTAPKPTSPEQVRADRERAAVARELAASEEHNRRVDQEAELRKAQEAAAASGAAAAWLSVSPPDTTQAAGYVEMVKAQLKELADEQARIDAEVTRLKPKVISSSGPRWSRGQIKQSAKRADVDAYNALRARFNAINDQVQAIKEVNRRHFQVLRQAELAAMVNNPKASRLSRFGARAGMLIKAGMEVPDSLLSALNAEARAEVLAKVPDANEQEIKKLDHQVASAAMGGRDVADEWRLNPAMQVNRWRQEELFNLVREARQQVGIPNEALPAHLVQELDRQIPGYQYSTTAEQVQRPQIGAPPITRADLARVAAEMVKVQNAVLADRKRAELAKEAADQAEKDEIAKAKEETKKFVAEAQNVASSAGKRTGKAIKAELVERLDAAVEAAPVDLGGDGKPRRIAVGIPGDGVFVLTNTKKTLAEVRDRAKRMSTDTEAPQPSAWTRSTGGNPPKPGTATTASAVKKVLEAGFVTPEEANRPALTKVWSDGKRMVATNGSLLVEVTPDGAVPKDMAEGFPTEPADDMLSGATKEAKVSVSTEDLWRASRAAQKLEWGDNTATMELWLGPNGELYAEATDRQGDFAGYGVKVDGAKSLGWVNPDLLERLAELARKVGNEQVSLGWLADSKKRGTVGGLAVKGSRLRGVLARMQSPQEVAEAKAKVDAAKARTAPRSTNSNARGAQAFPGGPIGTAPARPADNPQFSAFPLALPEAVETVQALLRGQVPKLKEHLRILAGNALGVFRHRDDAGQAEIELRRDLWMLDDEALARLKTEAEMYAQRTEPTPGAEQDRIRQEYLDHLVKEHAKSNPPLIALKVLWHEIGHLVDWLPQHRITGRGNLFGHIAALKKYLRHSLPMGPGIADNPVTAADKARLRKEAEAELHRELGGLREIIERIVVDEPVYAQLKITPEDVKALFGMDARERTPELYRWFAGLPDEAKVEIVRKAMKGILDERLNSVAGTQQVGTRKVERIVRRREGREPTKAEILERFRRKFREELARRQMADLDLLKDELRSLIAWWNGTATMPDYFKTPEEMYAEAFSAFVNNPAAVAERAPTFYRMVHAYMDARPEVADVYARLQDAMRQGTIMPHRVARLREMWRQADADGMDFQKGRDAARTRDALDNVLYHVDRVFGPMYRRARRSNRPAPVRQAIGDYLYRAADHERFLTRSNAEVGKPLVDANLDWADFGEYLFHKHITESRYVRDPQTGVLRPIANPYGWSADESAKRLAELEAQLGPQRWAVLVNAQRAFRRLYEEMVVEPLRRSGLATGPLMDAITNRVFYATFAAVKDKAESGIDTLFDASFGSGVGAKIFHQVGNLGRIKNPATATVLKALSLTSAIHRNNLKRELVALMRETDPTMIRPADTRWNGRRQEPVIRDTETVGTLVVMEEGKPQAYYVPRQMADMVDAGPVTTNWFMLRAMQATRGLKSLFTQINYGFWPVAFMRDAVGWTMQMPGATTPLHWARLMPSSIQAARDSVRNIRPNRLADEFLRRRMAISRASPAGFHDVTDNEYDLAVASYGLNPAQWAKEADRQHALARAWQWWRETGQIFERAHKIAGMQYLDRQHPNMPEWKKQEIVRERAGSPDFLQKGRSNPYIDFVAMFYNPWKEGLRSVVKSARENPWSFTAKGTALVIAPTVLQGLASAGMFGDDLRDAYRSIPDYDATNYLCLPLFWADKQDGKVAYLRLPLWEPARILHGTLYKTITGRGQGYASYLGGQVPGMNPLIDVVTAWATYEVAGQNPYDAYRGQHWLSEDVLKAGGWAARQEMLKQTWNNLGGGIVGTFKQVRLDEPPPGTVEQALSIPVISNLAGRWVKVSNRGLYDRDRQLGIPIDQYRAQVRLSVAPVVEKILTGQALSQSERVLMREPYAQEYLRARLPKAARERASVLADRLSRATTKEQRQAILRGASK